MSTTTHPPQLLTIPRELRNKIYAHLGVVTKLAVPEPKYGYSVFGFRLHHLHNHNILCVCKQFQDEVLDIEGQLLELQLLNVLMNGLYRPTITCEITHPEPLRLVAAARRCRTVVRMPDLLNGIAQVHEAFPDREERYTQRLVQQLKDIVRGTIELTAGAKDIDLALDMGDLDMDIMGRSKVVCIGQDWAGELKVAQLAALETEQSNLLGPATKFRLAFRFSIPKYRKLSTIPVQKEMQVGEEGEERSTEKKVLGTRPSDEHVEWCLKPLAAGQEGDEGFPGLRLKFVREYTPVPKPAKPADDEIDVAGLRLGSGGEGEETPAE